MLNRENIVHFLGIFVWDFRDSIPRSLPARPPRGSPVIFLAETFYLETIPRRMHIKGLMDDG